MRRLRFFYDFVCPYAYLASLQIDEVAREAGVELVREPILLGGLFRLIGAPDHVPMVPARAAMNVVDMERFARRLGVELRPPANHPRRTVLALRAALASSHLETASRALYRAYWREGRDLSDEGEVTRALDEAGLDGSAAVAAAGTASIKEALTTATSRAAAAGAFGVPTFVVEDGAEHELFFGQDRLDFVRRRLGLPDKPVPTRGAPTRPLVFHFDFSSPFAYLASTQVRALAARAATSLAYRPLLLGGLFRSIGTPNVPMLAMPSAKQAYTGRELERFARHLGVPFRFNTSFPVNTVKALRLVLVAREEDRPSLVDALFRATWVEDRDVSQESVLGEVLASIGMDAATMLGRIQHDDAKEALKQATTDAETRGIFGVPTFEVGTELFWGQDRLQLVEEALLA